MPQNKFLFSGITQNMLGSLVQVQFNTYRSSVHCKVADRDKDSPRSLRELVCAVKHDWDVQEINIKIVLITLDIFRYSDRHHLLNAITCLVYVSIFKCRRLFWNPNNNTRGKNEDCCRRIRIKVFIGEKVGQGRKSVTLACFMSLFKNMDKYFGDVSYGTISRAPL